MLRVVVQGGPSADIVATSREVREVLPPGDTPHVKLAAETHEPTASKEVDSK